MATVQTAPQYFPVHYKSARINDLDIFYREAGAPDSPAILLLHGFPTSSNMFRNLIPRLADSFHLIAPDYPGFGQSSMPDRSSFSYTFENLTNVVEHLVEALRLTKVSLYVMDYGAPVGFRLALRHPERVNGLIVQNGNAYEEGLLEFWNPLRKYWEDPSSKNRDALHFVVDRKSTQWQYENGVKDRTLLDPTAWILDQVGLDRPGSDEIQLDLFYDYRTKCIVVSGIPGISSAVSTAHSDRLGQERCYFPGGRRRSICARPKDSGNSLTRYRPFRARNSWRRNR